MKIQAFSFLLAAVPMMGSSAWAADQKVAVRFQAMVGSEKFACGQTYSGIGTTASKLTPRDFRFYIHNVALIDDTGKAVPVQLDQDGKWQLDDTALLDFENATGGCVNGTPTLTTGLQARFPPANTRDCASRLAFPSTRTTPT